MTVPSHTLSIQVDVTNPGQFFACCGLLELTHRLWPGAEGWHEGAYFHCAPMGSGNGSLAAVLDALTKCEVRTEMTRNERSTDENSKPKSNPIFVGPPVNMMLDWWQRDDGTPNLFKTWAANATSQQMFTKWQKPLKEIINQGLKETERVFNAVALVQGSYGFDSTVGWDSLSVGFSLNEHVEYKRLPTHPAVELLGCIGLQRFFPHLDAKRQTVRYATWDTPLSPLVARLACIGQLPAVALRRLETRFVYRGSFKGLDTAKTIGGESYDRHVGAVRRLA